MRPLVLCLALLLAAAPCWAQGNNKRIEACTADFCPPGLSAVSGSGQVDNRQPIDPYADEEPKKKGGTWVQKPGDELMRPDWDEPTPTAKPKRREPKTDFERDARRIGDASGRKFADTQSEMNHMLCKQGNSGACKYIRYAADDPGPPQKNKPGGNTTGNRGGNRGGGTGGGHDGHAGHGGGGGSGSGSGSGGGDGGGDDGGDDGGGGDGDGDGGGKGGEGAGGVVSKSVGSPGSVGGGRITDGAGSALASGAALGGQLKAERKDSLPDGARPGPQGMTAGLKGGGLGAGGGPGAGGGTGAGGGFGGGEGSAGSSSSAGSSGASGGLDLAAAAASGFSASFAKTGLKMGSGGQVLRADGNPASASEVAGLRNQIASDPAALMKRPDFFDALGDKKLGGRERHDRLKGDFEGKPEERDGAFKDVGVTEQKRDFVHTETCNPKLEKDCNEKIKEPYKKGEFVSPEDLKAIDEALHADSESEADSDSPDELSGEPGPERRVMDKSAARSIAARLNALLGGAAGFFTRGVGDKQGPVSSAGETNLLDTEETASPAGGPAATRRGTPRLYAQGKSKTVAGPGRSSERPKQAAAITLRWWQAAAALGMVGAWFWSRRKQRSFMER